MGLVCAGLLTRDPLLRLGSKGAAEVKAHPFFASIDWGMLETGQVMTLCCDACACVAVIGHAFLLVLRRSRHRFALSKASMPRRRTPSALLNP